MDHSRGFGILPMPFYSPSSPAHTHIHTCGSSTVSHPPAFPHATASLVWSRVVQVLPRHTAQNGLVHPPKPTAAPTEVAWVARVSRERRCAQFREGTGPGGWVHQEQRAGCVYWRWVAAQRTVPHPRTSPSSTAAGIACLGVRPGMRRCEDTVSPLWAGNERAHTHTTTHTHTHTFCSQRPRERSTGGDVHLAVNKIERCC